MSSPLIAAPSCGRAGARRVGSGGGQEPLSPVSYYDSTVEVLGSALKHGVDPDDIEHALQHALVIEEVGQDPTRYLVLGPDRSANLLELVVLDRPNGPVVIHAMPMRPQYQRLLTPQGK